jgi:altronate hydrolase
MAETALQIDPRDNVLVALAPLAEGTVVHFGHPPAADSCPVTQNIPAKHKLALADLKPGDLIRMYGMVVGEVVESIARGGLLSTRNVRHRADPYTATRHPASFALPDASAWQGRTFLGFHRDGGQVGTRNYWLVLPLVFCENRNVERMREALEEELGYGSDHNSYRQYVRRLVRERTSGNGHGAEDAAARARSERVFPTRAAAAARARMRKPSADCWPDTSIIPTWLELPSSASVARTRRPACFWTSCVRAIPKCANPCWCSISRSRGANRP